MASSLRETTMERAYSLHAASGATELVRKGEMDAALAEKASVGHTHSGEEVPGLAGVVDGRILSARENSNSIGWSGEASLKPELRVKSGGALTVTAEGVSVTLGTGEEEAARGSHTHAGLQASLTVEDTDSVDLTLAAGVLRAEVVVNPSGGLRLGDSGAEVDGSRVSMVGHTHEGLHAAVTVVSSSSVALSVNGQELSAVARLDDAPPSGYGRLEARASGLVVKLGGSGDEAAAGNHTHGQATNSQSGFMSPVHYRTVEAMRGLSQVDQVTSFVRADFLPQGEYVGGRRRWGQAMQVVGIDVVCRAPVGLDYRLGLEVGGVVQEHVLVPAGNANAEVLVAVDPSDLFVPADTYVRILCESGIENEEAIEWAASQLDVALMMRPAAGNAPEYRINCGGPAAYPYGEDEGYDGGGAQFSLLLVNTYGVEDAAPVEVYQSARSKYNSTTPLCYHFTGLGRGIEYQVRLHFAELCWTAIGDQRMKLEVVGKTTEVLDGFDILAETSRLVALVKEFYVEATSEGAITVRLTPLSGNGGGYHASINGIDVLPPNSWAPEQEEEPVTGPENVAKTTGGETIVTTEGDAIKIL